MDHNSLAEALDTIPALHTVITINVQRVDSALVMLQWVYAPDRATPWQRTPQMRHVPVNSVMCAIQAFVSKLATMALFSHSPMNSYRTEPENFGFYIHNWYPAAPAAPSTLRRNILLE